MRKKSFRYLTCCVNSTAKLIGTMIDAARDITLRTFLRRVPAAELREVFPGYAWGPQKGLHLKDDWHITCHKSRYGGQSCYFVIHSAIEYVFVEEGE